MSSYTPFEDTPEQRDLWAALDPVSPIGNTTGRDLADVGASNAENSLDTRWRLWAEKVLDDLIDAGAPFTADDLRAVVGSPPDGKHVNGIGGLFRRAYRDGRIRHVGYRPSTRTEARGRVVRVWTGAQAA